MSLENLDFIYSLSDSVDRREGALAYGRYHALLTKIAHRYDVPLERAVAVFAAVSPNNDYIGNLRSTISILDGWRDGLTFDDVTISTYRHCGERAWRYLTGEASFLREVKGLKIRSFYSNILDPSDPQHVTIDGHVVGAWRGSDGTMKDLIIKPLEYVKIAIDVSHLARRYDLIPNQMQATIWFTRKRVLRIRYNAQLSLLHGVDDQWRTIHDLDDIRPFPGAKA